MEISHEQVISDVEKAAEYIANRAKYSPPGFSSGDLAKRLGVSPITGYRSVQRLLRDGMIRESGIVGNTRYYVWVGDGEAG